MRVALRHQADHLGSDAVKFTLNCGGVTRFYGKNMDYYLDGHLLF